MASKKHTHKYYFGLELAGTKVWACALPHCFHFMPYHMESLVMGKASLCWKCDGVLIIESIHKKMLKPVCNECILTGAVPLPKGIMLRDMTLLSAHTEEIKNHPIPQPEPDELSPFVQKMCPECKTHPVGSNKWGLCVACAFNKIGT